MEIVSLVANARGVTEREVVYGYTHRQLTHIAGAMFKDRMLLLDVLSGALSGKSGGKGGGKGKGGKKSVRGRVTDLRGVKSADQARALISGAMAAKR